MNKSQVARVEAARHAPGRRLIAPLLDQDGQLPVLLLDPALEEEILAMVSPENSQRLLAAATTPSVPVIRRLTESVKSLIGASTSPVLPVLLCPSPARYYVRRWLEPFPPRLAVVAAAEIPPQACLKPAGRVHQGLERARRSRMGMNAAGSVAARRKGVFQNPPDGQAGVISGEQERLLLEHLPIVRFLARRIHERLPQHVDIEDLVSAGVLGLMDAFSKFDPQQKVQFRSYAQFRIRGAILDSRRTLDWSPRDLRRKGRAVEDAIRVLTARLGRAGRRRGCRGDGDLPGGVPIPAR